MNVETKMINKQLFKFFFFSPINYITSFLLYGVGMSEGYGRITPGKQSSESMNYVTYNSK